jgi:uncharacterized membrane protein YdjX (TVP38/TMEM64 family)
LVQWFGYPVMRAATRRQLIGLGGLVAVAAIASVLFSFRGMLSWFESLAARPLLFVVALAVLYLVRPFLLWPVTSVAVLLGFLYGPAIGFGLALLGAAFTALPPYLLGRYAQTEIGLFGYVGDTFEAFFETVGDIRGVIAARFSPIPGDPISYAAGLSGVPAGPFLVGTMIGEVPWALIAVFAGASMRTLRFSEFSLSPELLVTLFGLAVLLLARPVYNRLAESESVDAEPTD